MHTPAHRSPHHAWTAWALAASLVACGGGGGGDPAPVPVSGPTVSTVAVGTARYGGSVQFTVSGSGLDATLSAASAACRSAPVLVGSVSATSAVFECSLGSVGAASVSVSAGTAVLATQAFTVPQPQVTLAVSNGLGVNGSIVVTLDPARTPITVDNFLAYVGSGFYNGTVMHRVVPGFVVQGGGYTGTSPGVVPTPKPTNAPITLEVGKGLSNVQWTIAMARGTAANSATAQFFFNVVDNSAGLDPNVTTAGYAVFGSIASGTSVVTAMLSAPCAPIAGFSECAPNPNVVITSATQTQ
jgi:cyclophilin family peptidyl-prolyl cis-trans isomerase